MMLLQDTKKYPAFISNSVYFYRKGDAHMQLGYPSPVCLMSNRKQSGYITGINDPDLSMVFNGTTD